MNKWWLVPLLSGALLTLGCNNNGSAGNQPAEDGLADKYQSHFLVGTAISSWQLMSPKKDYVNLVCNEFNVYTAENAMKWQRIHPEPGQYKFDTADKMFDLAEQCGAQIIGHTLVWHSQTPDWVFEDDEGNPLTRDTLLARLNDHITTVMTRYKGRVKGWDVVNEALNEDGTMRDSPWFRIIGDDYLIKAFEFARAADPETELYYNDYNLNKAEKVAGAVRLVKQLEAAGVKPDAVGMQAHYSVFYPEIEEVEQSIQALIAAGVNVAITELDVTVLPQPETVEAGADIASSAEYEERLNPYTDGLPDAQQETLSQTYEALFSLFLKYDAHVDRVTLWGVDDGSSWRNNFPVRGRTDYALLFDRNSQPKPVYHALKRLIE
ncbi:MAG: endo-1,4-beta-xylanase [Alteromonadaceae bacterium]|nr:endo-1,4-beta-xylanase [Alteromonadaceae bacterium]